MNFYVHVYFSKHPICYRMEMALIQADDDLKLTEIARDLLSRDEDVKQAAAKKYTCLADHVKDCVMDSEEVSLEEVQIFINTCAFMHVLPW